MSMIQISNLSFTYQGSFTPVFQNVSLTLDTSWRLGLIGRNGRGKTTLLRLLQGALGPYEGHIQAPVSFLYFPFAVADPSLSAQEIAYALCPNLALWELKRELSLLEVKEEALHQAFSSLSFGERTKVMLAVLFLHPHAFLLIDEPTNHLDMHARQVVARYLHSKQGFLLVSHDRAFLDDCVDHILSINRSNIQLVQGNYSSWQTAKQREDAFDLAQNERLKGEISRLSAAAAQKANWSYKTEKSKFGGEVSDRGFVGHQSAKMMKRAKSIQARQQKALEQKEQLLHNIDETEALTIRPLGFLKPRLLDVQDLCLRFGPNTVVKNLSFTLERGERIALCGPNGCGKSSVLKAVLGQIAPVAGQVMVPPQLKISYVSQDASFLQGSLRAFAAAHNLDESLFKAILRKMGFARTQFEKPMEDLSEGQKKKVLLACSLCEEAHLYVWDEPLNFLDIDSRAQIETLLLQKQVCLLFVEHDQNFVQAISTKQIWLNPQGEAKTIYK